MGTSHPETKPWVVEKILRSGVERVLDVGAGAGNWADALRAAGYKGHIAAVEVWEPYIYAYRLHERYDHVHQLDVRHAKPTLFARYGCVIFGDVLEHMTAAEAMAVWHNARYAPHAAIAIPVIHYEQGALNRNPYETHVDADWDEQRVLASFPGLTDRRVFTITAAFWR